MNILEAPILFLQVIPNNNKSNAMTSIKSNAMTSITVECQNCQKQIPLDTSEDQWMCENICPNCAWNCSPELHKKSCCLLEETCINLRKTSADFLRKKEQSEGWKKEALEYGREVSKEVEDAFDEIISMVMKRRTEILEQVQQIMETCCHQADHHSEKSSSNSKTLSRQAQKVEEALQNTTSTNTTDLINLQIESMKLGTEIMSSQTDYISHMQSFETVSVSFSKFALKAALANFGSIKSLVRKRYLSKMPFTIPPPCRNPTTIRIENSPGKIAFKTPGRYEWTVPPGVNFINAILVGGGGGGSDRNSNGVDGGPSSIVGLTGAMVTAEGGEGGSENPGAGGAGNYSNGGEAHSRFGGASDFFRGGYRDQYGHINRPYYVDNTYSREYKWDNPIGAGGAGIKEGGGAGGYSKLCNHKVEPGTRLEIFVGQGGHSTVDVSRGANGMVVITWNVMSES